MTNEPASGPHAGTEKKCAMFQPTSEMIAAASTLFCAMAFSETIRPVVEGYQFKILSERPWMVKSDMRARSDRKVERVTDIKLTYLMSTEDFAEYDKRCKEERVFAGLKVENEAHCPLLVAEGMVRDAKFALAQSMEEITKVPAARAVTLPMHSYDQLIDLSLRLLAPFVPQSPELMAQARKLASH